MTRQDFRYRNAGKVHTLRRPDVLTVAQNVDFEYVAVVTPQFRHPQKTIIVKSGAGSQINLNDEVGRWVMRQINTFLAANGRLMFNIEALVRLDRLVHRFVLEGR